MTTFIIRSNRVGPVLGRHPWVFSGAIQHIPDGLPSGEPVILTDESGHFLAQGYFNSYSQIAVRVWSWDEKEAVDEDFFLRRVKSALELRQDYLADQKTDAYRLINSENDFLPGLIVDKYGDYLCLQFHNRGIEHWKERIVGALRTIMKPEGIYERSDVRVRGIEGAEKQAGLLWGKVLDRVKILENGYKFWVDIINGQKTGFFLDQRDKRLALQKYAAGKNVLNCFAYTGGFSVYALAAGAERAVSVDASAGALELAKENFKLNKLKVAESDFVCADVKDYLYGLQQNAGTEKFKVIVLDPPAFVKDRHKIKEGLQGYRKINEAALRLLPPGGILATCSCSAHVSMADFRYMLSESAGRARRTVQILETFTHGLDHPQLAAFTEGEYLKCLFARVL